MARIAKTLKPEQGYAHREHRSRKGMSKTYFLKKAAKRRKRLAEEARRQAEMDKQLSLMERRSDRRTENWL